MLLDNNGDSFRTVGLYQARGLEWEETSLKLLPVESAQTHYNILTDGRPAIIDFSEPNSPMKIREVKQLFYQGVTSAVLVPISNGENNIGIISLGDMRNKSRNKIESDDLNFATATASRIGLVLEAYALNQKLQSSTKVNVGRIINPDENPKSWSRYYNRVMNALSGIIGSAELVSTTMQDDLDPRITKYLDVIQNNGEKIRNLTADFDMESKDERKTTQQNERMKQLESILLS
jgi:transcriptional regulator with GAF, ATPase, and Fis domain